jgi:KUP system potassium uptake protein
MFKESGKLAAAFGLAVSGTMAITSVVYFYVIRYTWRWPLWKAGAVVGLFLSFDLPFFAANTLKFLDGGYVPFAVGVLFVTVMVNWRIGRGLLGQYLQARSEPLDKFIGALDQRVRTRVPGAAVFMASGEGVPPAMRRIVNRFHALPETIIVLRVVVEHVPEVAASERVKDVRTLGKGCHRLTLHYGFMEEENVPADLTAAIAEVGIAAGADDLVYVLGHETIVASPRGQMGTLWEGLFAFLSRNAKSAIDYFGLPPEQVIEVGARIDL